MIARGRGGPRGGMDDRENMRGGFRGGADMPIRGDRGRGGRGGPSERGGVRARGGRPEESHDEEQAKVHKRSRGGQNPDSNK
jgi:hypothetical protein